MLTALFVGAHPDDLEIGAGGTIAKLAHEGWNVWLIIMTDDQDAAIAQIRQREARDAAAILGVREEQVKFLGALDGLLATGPEVVQKMRDATREIAPDLVFTHSLADDHQDHRATHEITCAAMRRRPRLYFPVINHLRLLSFTPQIFVDVSGHWEGKLAALRCHRSQAQRINEQDITNYYGSFIGSAGLVCAEAYELEMPVGSEAGAAQVASINDSRFHRLWSMLLGDRPLIIISSVPISRSVKEFNWPSHHDQTGLALFRRNMDLRWKLPGGGPAIEDYRCDLPQAEEKLKSGTDVLLCGGPVSNSITRDYLNHFDGLRYVIDYTMPDYRKIRILDRERGDIIQAEYERDMHGGMVPKTDVGILTIMRNPYNRDSVLVAVMGIHGFGTIGCFKAISEPPLISKLLSHIDIPFAEMAQGYQILVKHQVRTDETSFVDESTSVMIR